MKYYLPLLTIMSVLIFSHCSKDAVTIAPQTNAFTEDLAYIQVRVTIETEAAESNGCCHTGTCEIGLDATVMLFPEGNRTAPGIRPAAQLNTNEKGYVLFEDLPLHDYTVVIQTRQGDVERLIKPRNGKLTRMYVRF